MQKRSELADIFPLPVEAKRLHFFLGNWKVDGGLTFMGRTFGVKGDAKFSLAAAGWGVLVIAKLEIEGLGVYEEADILAFNRNEKTYHFFAVTNTAAAFDHTGNWLNDNVISFSYEGSHDGKKYKEELSIIIQDQNQITINEKDSIENQIVTTMDVTLKKEID